MNFRFSYDGPVLEFDKVIDQRWKSSTLAPSEAKARSNLTFQFKRQYGKAPASKITLPGRIVMEGDRHVRY